VGAALPGHPAHKDKVSGSVREFKRTAVELLRNMDYSGLRQELAKFETTVAYGGFTNAPIEKSQREVWRFRAEHLEWSSADFDSLISNLQAGEKITAMTAEAATTSNGRRLPNRHPPQRQPERPAPVSAPRQLRTVAASLGANLVGRF
jgi:hypothetical protein